MTSVIRHCSFTICTKHPDVRVKTNPSDILCCLFVQDKDAQNNVILEEDEEDVTSSRDNVIASVPVNVIANTTFLHLHADIPFADDDEDELDVRKATNDVVNKETNQSNSINKNSETVIGGGCSLIQQQNNKNQSESSFLPAKSSSTSQTTTAVESTKTGCNKTDNSQVTTESSNNQVNITGHNIETSVQVHSNSNADLIGSPNSNTACLLANQCTVSAANDEHPDVVLANEHLHNTEHARRDSESDAQVESLVFTESVYPIEQFDGDEIFV